MRAMIQQNDTGSTYVYFVSTFSPKMMATVVPTAIKNVDTKSITVNGSPRNFQERNELAIIVTEPTGATAA